MYEGLAVQETLVNTHTCWLKHGFLCDLCSVYYNGQESLLLFNITCTLAPVSSVHETLEFQLSVD